MGIPENGCVLKHLDPQLKKIYIIYLAVLGLSGEGNGIPLQYCCLENPMGGGAW